eukprot:jgi/Astpho2/5890/Aster-x1334
MQSSNTGQPLVIGGRPWHVQVLSNFSQLKGPSVPAPAALGARREPAPSWAPIAAQEGPKCVVAHPDWVLAAAPVPAADAAGAPAGVARASAGQRDEGAAAGSTVAVHQGGFAAGLLCHAARASRVASAAASRLAWPVGEAAERIAQPDLAKQVKGKGSLLDATEADFVVPKVTPVLSYGILLVNVALYAAGITLRYTRGDSSSEDFFYLLALQNSDVLSGQYYRLVSSFFLHDSFLHLILNSAALFQLAPEAEAVLGYPTFAAVYLLSGLGAGLATIAFSDTISVGASACIFGLIGALAGYLWRNRSIHQTGQQLGLVAAVCAFNLLAGSDHRTAVENLGHITGLACGLYLGWGMAPKLTPSPDSSPENGKLVTAVDAIRPVQHWATALSLLLMQLGVLAVILEERAGRIPFPHGLGL